MAVKKRKREVGKRIVEVRGGGAKEIQKRSGGGEEWSGEVPPAPVTLKANAVWESVMNVDSPECSLVYCIVV